MKKRLLSLALVFVMVLGMLPVQAFATDNSVTVGFTAVDCLTDGGKVEVMRKELTVEPGLAKQYLDGEYGGSVGMTTEVGENDVTPIDVLVAAHIDEYGDAFTDSTAENYITGFDYASRMFGADSEITYTANGIQPATNGTGYAINQYIVQDGDEIAFYRMSWFSETANLYASFDKPEAEVETGEELTLKLGFCSTMGYVDEPIPAANVDICALNEDGTIGEKITDTDEAGYVTVSFDAAGTYYLTCKGETSFLADTDWDGVAAEETTGTLSPAYCKITVKKAAAPKEPVEPTVIDTTLGGSFMQPNSDGWIKTITVSGDAAVEHYVVNRNATVDIFLAEDTAEDATFDVTFAHDENQYWANYVTMEYSGDLGTEGTGEVQLVDGEKTISVTTTTVNSMWNSRNSTTWTLNFKPYVAPTSIELDKSELELIVRGTETLTATIGPENSSVKTAAWSSSDETVATVSSSGKVTGKGAGTVTITATAGSKKATCTVTVKTVDVESITLDKTELTLPVGGTETLKATILPDTATENKATWISSNEAVATVSSSGKITAVALGETTITAKAGEKEATCVVTVGELPPTLGSDIKAENDVYLGVNETYELTLDTSKIFVDPEGGTMTYTVSVNGGEAEEANGVYYTYTPTVEGVTTLVFKATDDKGNESADTYTVKIHALTFTRIGTYTDPNTNWTDNWSCGIPYFEIAAEKIVEDPTGEVEAYVVLSSETAKDVPVFVRVGFLDTRNRFSGMYVNGQKVNGTFVRNDAKKEWSGLVTLNWNDKNEAEAVFQAEPRTGDNYKYTLRFKLADTNNTAPTFADGGSKTDSVMQYFDYTVDVKSLFIDADDSWLSYSVAVDDGEFAPCTDSYVFNGQTTGAKTLKFKAADVAGKESDVFTLSLDVTEYATPADSFAIGDMTEKGGVLSVTILDNDGNPIEGAVVTVGEIEDIEETTSGTTWTAHRRIIDVTLPGNEGQVGVSDTIKAYFHTVHDETGWPVFTSSSLLSGPTQDRWNAEGKITDIITTKLSGGLGTGYGHLYEKEPTTGTSEYGWNNERTIYELRYHIARENNQAPQLKDGVTSPIEVTQEQYTSYTLNAKNLLTDPEGDKITYYISINGGAFEEFNGSRTFDLSEAGVTRIDINAKDALGAEGTCTIYITATRVLRYAIETGEGAGTFVSGLNKIFLYGVEGEKHVLAKEGYVRDIMVQLKADVADDAEIEMKWEGNADNVTMTVANPVKLVDGKAAFTIETHGHFFDKNHRYYNFTITNTPNNAPILAAGVEATAEETVLIGETLDIDLSTYFTDADGDALTYTVSINGADAVAADAAYRYTPAELGTYTLVFRAADKWGTSEASYTVTLTAKNSDVINTVTFKVPDEITPAFYTSAGFDANNQDILGIALETETGASADGWTSYSVSVPDNIRRVSFRGTAGETAWGGMSVAVKDYEDNVITTPFVLRQLEGIINTKLDNDAAPTAEQAVFKVKYGEGAYAISGGDFTDRYGSLGYRFLLLAADNSLIYTYYATPLGDLTSTYAESQGDTKTITSEVAAKATAVMKLANKSAFSITAPSAATVQFFRQIGNYNVIELQPYETVSNNDGTKTVTFNSNGGMFRVSMEGKITKAGYCDGDSIIVSWNDDDRGPDYRAEYDTTTNFGHRGNDSTYVNVNYRNNLRLDVNETFQLRAYRLWQIINNDTANVMIEPDFHYNVISGDDVISITPSAGCSGNAKNNWLDVKGLKAGTAVIEVTYDALDLISNGSKDQGGILAANHFTFNAVDPARTALIVVQVGAEQNDIDFGIRNNAGNVWDAEHDTLCFTGDSAELKFSPTVTSGSISKVEVSNDKSASWTVLTAENGEYTARIVHGSNIIRITKDDGTVSYQIVRGYKLTIVLSEVEGKSDMDGTVEPGETVTLWLKGYHNPVGKMSGIYNMQSTTLYFMVNGQQISRTCSAYGFYGDCKINVMIPGTAQGGDTIVLEDGYATTSGFGAGGGAHRGIAGEVPPNLDADTVGSGYNIYDDIAITVGSSTVGEIVEATGVTLNVGTASVERGKSITLTAAVTPANATDKTVTWTSTDSAVAVVSSSGKVTGVSEGTVTITASIGEHADTCTVTVTKAAGGNTPGENPDLEFGLSQDEILGYVTVSFADNGIRKREELSTMEAEFRNPLGMIISATSVPFKAYDTIASVTLRLLEENGFTADYEGDEYSSFYLASIGNFTHNGTYYERFGEFDAGKDSGWMIAWDDWFINKGASEFAVADGDVIQWKYTCQLGEDIRNDSADAAVEAVKAKIDAIGEVTLEKEAEITAAREAYDELTPVQQSQVDNYETLAAAEAALAALKANDEDKAAADAVAEKIAAIGTVTLNSESAINEAKAAYATLSDTQKLLVENYEVLAAAEDALEALKTAGLDEMYDATAETLLDQTPDTGSVGGEWLVFGLARATDKELTSAQKAAYEAAVKAYINANINSAGQLNENKPTENERIALALTALGYDPTSYNGKNLLSALENTAWATKQGNNSTAFALLAFNAAGYDASNETALIQSLLNNQLASGGWNINSGSADADTTAMVVQALAPYYSTNSEVKTAVDKALAYLKVLMNAKGQIDNGTDEPSVETVAQTIVALCELGIDPITWKTENNVNLLHGLASFYVNGAQKGFSHEENGSYDQLSTEQGFYAMVACKRFLDANATSLYDMSDLVNLYRIEILASENGSITASKTAAAAGETITVTAQPLTGYVLSKLTLNDVELTIAENSATFTMPAGTAILEATFTKTANTANAIAEAMLALDVKDASEETYDLIEELREAYSGLTAAEKLEIREAYDAFMDQIDAFEEYLEEAVEEGAEELEEFIEDLDEDDYSKKAWDKIEDLYDEALEALEEAHFEEEVLELLEAYLEELEEAAAGELEVTFRLIGDWKHDDGVDGHDEYVTWIETTEYNMPAGSTIYDLFMQAMDDFDLNQKGASKNYVESIQAPDILGGYWIGEFDNGPNSGWMYTINGDHPGYGLKEQDLEDGDEVIWHYVDDYTLEERKTTSKYYERWLEADDIDPETWVKRNLDKIVEIEGQGEVTPELKVSHIGKDVTFAFEPAEGWVIKNVYADGKDKGAIESYKYKDLSMASRIEVVFALANQPYFVDVPETEWFYEDVMFVVNNGLFNGTGEYTFSPNAPMTRAMLVTVLHRLEGQPAVYGSSFSDVQSGQWYSDAVAWAARNGIVTGYDNGKFGVNDNVTREQMAAILYRYANYKGYDVTDRANLNGYVDAGSISSYAVDAMSWANAKGLINGRTYNTLAPTGTATRAEVAAIFHRFVENIVK